MRNLFLRNKDKSGAAGRSYGIPEMFYGISPGRAHRAVRPQRPCPERVPAAGAAEGADPPFAKTEHCAASHGRAVRMRPLSSADGSLRKPPVPHTPAGGGCERRTPRPGGAGCRQDAEGRQVRISGCVRLPCGRVQARADARNRGLRTRRERARTAAEARRRTAARSARSRGARTIAACGPCIRVRRTAWADRGPRIRCSLAAADGDAARCGTDDVTIRNFELQFSDEASYFYKIFHTFANKST